MAADRLVTELKIPFRPIFLDKDSLRNLCDIVLKAAENDQSAYITLRIEGKSEKIETESIDSLINARFPRGITDIILRAESRRNGREINIRISEIGASDFTFGNIEVSSSDTDWVSARTRELDDFMNDHRSFHWLFQNVWSIMIQMILLSILLGYTLWNMTSPGSIGIVLPICFVYFLVTRKMFPAVVIKPERTSALTIMRKFLTFAIPAIFLGLIVQLISRLIWPN